MIGIYKIENVCNGKKYIGKSNNIESRWIHHKWLLNSNKHINKPLQNAWNKYGENNFEFSIIHTCNDDSVLPILEKYYISLYNSFIKNSGYNLTVGGDGCAGRIITDDFRKKIGDFHRGKKLSQKQVEYMKNNFVGSGNPFYGRSHKEETRKQISEHHLSSGCSKGGNNPRAKKVICDGIIYGCATDCGNSYGIKSCTIRSWLRGNRPMPERFQSLGLKYL